TSARVFFIGTGEVLLQLGRTHFFLGELPGWTQAACLQAGSRICGSRLRRIPCRSGRGLSNSRTGANKGPEEPDQETSHSWAAHGRTIPRPGPRKPPVTHGARRAPAS